MRKYKRKVNRCWIIHMKNAHYRVETIRSLFVEQSIGWIWDNGYHEPTMGPVGGVQKKAWPGRLARSKRDTFRSRQTAVPPTVFSDFNPPACQRLRPRFDTKFKGFQSGGFLMSWGCRPYLYSAHLASTRQPLPSCVHPIRFCFETSTCNDIIFFIFLSITNDTLPRPSNSHSLFSQPSPRFVCRVCILYQF